MASERSSGQVLEALWERFAKRTRDVAGINLSKRATSQTYLEEDASQLGKWTRPGERRNWRIPLFKVARVCEKLGGSVDDRDDLMLARLRETLVDDENHDAVVAAGWALEYADRRLTADESQVLKAYREAARSFPAGLVGSGEESETLKAVFSRLLERAAAAHSDEHLAGLAGDKPEAAAAIQAYKDKMDARAQEGRRQVDAQRRHKSAAHITKAFLQAMRQRRP